MVTLLWYGAVVLTSSVLVYRVYSIACVAWVACEFVALKCTQCCLSAALTCSGTEEISLWLEMERSRCLLDMFAQPFHSLWKFAGGCECCDWLNDLLRVNVWLSCQQYSCFELIAFAVEISGGILCIDMDVLVFGECSTCDITFYISRPLVALGCI